MQDKKGQVAVEKTSFSASNCRGQVAIEKNPFSAGHLRAQVAAEFMLYIGVFMILLMAAFIVINDLQSSEIPLRQNTVAREVGDGFARSITLAVQGGSGFSYNYTFPKTIFDSPYTISIDDKSKTAILDWQSTYGNFSYSYKLPFYNYILIHDECISSAVISSGTCSNLLILNNDGQSLTIRQYNGG